MKRQLPITTTLPTSSEVDITLPTTRNATMRQAESADSASKRQQRLRYTPVCGRYAELKSGRDHTENHHVHDRPADGCQVSRQRKRKKCQHDGAGAIVPDSDTEWMVGLAKAAQQDRMTALASAPATPKTTFGEKPPSNGFAANDPRHSGDDGAPAVDADPLAKTVPETVMKMTAPAGVRWPVQRQQPCRGEPAGHGDETKGDPDHQGPPGVDLQEIPTTNKHRRQGDQGRTGTRTSAP